MNTFDWEEYLDQLIRDCADREATATLRAARATSTPGGEPGAAALPTIYRGTQFRSLLEASWAATLDSLGIVWEYEPQLFELPSGTKYLPDFHLTEIGVWLEVKGPGIPRIEKAFELGKALACGCEDRSCECDWPGGEMVIVGHPPERRTRRRGRFVRWTSTRRHNSWMTCCSGCRRITWVEGARLLRCPTCGAHNEAPLYRDFEDGFQFARLPWLSAACIPIDPASAA